MKHIYLSPHLDDAVLSCGGALHRHTTAGDSVLVITTFSGDFAGEVLSPFAQEQHDYWGNWPQIMTLRRAEDRAALSLLGAEGRYIDRLDAVYRVDPDGDWMYVNLETLFGELHPGDPMVRDSVGWLVDQFTAFFPSEQQCVIYAPLGVGHHVDHQIIHAAARQLLKTGYRVAFYEDYPYAEQPGATESAMAVAGSEGWPAEDISLDPTDLSAKVSALAYYASQMTMLFGGMDAMPNRIWSFAASRSPGGGLVERIWWPPTNV
jgi:LmbE family N-acetylglucosaminyl deacetylase